MPTYEYRCEQCGDFEQNQRITDPPLERCPTCRRKVRRLISSTSFQLKGSGWYVTDYGRSGANGGAKKEGTSSEASSTSATPATSTDKSESKTEGKGESKPAAPAASEKNSS